MNRAMTAFVASARADYLQGSIIDIDGGATRSLWIKRHRAVWHSQYRNKSPRGWRDFAVNADIASRWPTRPLRGTTTIFFFNVVGWHPLAVRGTDGEVADRTLGAFADRRRRACSAADENPSILHAALINGAG